MIIRRKPPRALGPDEPIRHATSHPRPVSRRDFLSRGFMSGSAVVVAPTVFSLFASPHEARAALSPDLAAMKVTPCNILPGAGLVPFIAFDLAGGASMAGSEILIGGQGGQRDFLSTAGYAKLGLPGDMVPNAPNAGSATNDFIDTSFGAAWHSDGAFLRGMLAKTSAAARAATNAAVIAARSENDTANNPHNPMYGIYRAGADGELLTLIGTQNSESGGNSVAPATMIDPAVRPAKVDRASDVTGLVDTGELGTLFSDPSDAVAVLESIARISHRKIDRVSGSFPVGRRQVLEDLVKCGYVKSADLADRFSSPAALNPDLDPHIVGTSGIFSQAEYNADSELRKTAAVMKMVIGGYAGAGTITMGGYDYHGQGRATGELRNFRAGQCIGACLEYAARLRQPLMLYVFSDGSVNANGQVDNTADGRGKFMWASDNGTTAASFFLVYSPNGRPQLLDGPGGLAAARHQQIGWFRADGSVETASHPGANAVNLLVEIVVLNYLALHGREGQFASLFPGQGLGSTQLQQALTSFARIV
ncbi:MAG: general secretion pathway protein GspF [Gammaproteobacteria bacterium]|nr:general secretion pathway protein GspF [Gammaproteobacteria bacterium]